MDVKELFVKMFPTEGHFRNYLRWRDHRRKEIKRQRKIREQMEQHQGEILAMTDDELDDDFEPMSADIWQKVNDVDN